MVTFGNLEFTKLALREIRANMKPPVVFFVVVGKPGDEKTSVWLRSEGIAFVAHKENLGFPASINDIYDWAWNGWNFDNVIIAGNDIAPYLGAIDALIECAETTEWEWICSSEYDSRALVRDHPEARRFFKGGNMVFSDFAARPWELHQPPRDIILEPNCIKDVRNLCLFKRSVFEKLGYADVNFWPGGYFEDNDYCRRAMLAGVKACGLRHSSYFHFWSRTIHQGSGETVESGKQEFNGEGEPIGMLPEERSILSDEMGWAVRGRDLCGAVWKWSFCAYSRDRI